MNKLYAVILAGGKGERFWPKSRANFPKQFVALFGKDSLVQQTYKRVKKIIPIQNQLFVIPRELVSMLKKQIPVKSCNIINEPFGRNTAPAIALAAIYLERIASDSTMIVLPSDHLIEDEQNFFACVRFAYEIAQKDYLVTFGIPPAAPDTGFGYIHIGKEFSKQESISSYNGLKFVEKPNQKTAEAYLKAKTYFWNSGMFVWRVSAILEAVKKCMPEFYISLKNFQKYIGTNKEASLLRKIYAKAPATSIDYAVLEKVKNIVVVKANFSWDDVGSWQALERHFPKDESGNIRLAHFYGKDTENSIILSDHGMIATLGVKNLIIVQTKQATLILPKDKAAQIKELIKIIGKDKAGKKYL